MNLLIHKIIHNYINLIIIILIFIELFFIKYFENSINTRKKRIFSVIEKRKYLHNISTYVIKFIWRLRKNRPGSTYNTYTYANA